ncbi:MAG: ComEC/Rec2 family competence protein [Anaerolineaceae bacterium]
MPLLWLSLAFLAGILSAPVLGGSLTLWLGLAGGAILLTLALRFLLHRKPHPSWLTHLVTTNTALRIAPAALLAAFLLGGARWTTTQRPLTPADVGAYNGRGSVRLIGVIDSAPQTRDPGAVFTLRAEQMSLLGSADKSLFPVDGRVRVQIAVSGDWRYGDRIEVSGQLDLPEENGEGFSYRAWLARQGIQGEMPYAGIRLLAHGQGPVFGSALAAIQRKAAGALAALFPMPESALLRGILLGADDDLPADLQRAFQVTGTAHIITISGFNIAVLAGLFVRGFTRWLGARRGAAAALVGILLYTLLVGAQPPVARAAVMGGLSLFAAQVGRRQNGLNSLAFTAALLCLLNPQLPWDVSFQLSFTATLGLVLFAESFTTAFSRFSEDHLPPRLRGIANSLVGEYLLVTLAAQITSLPVMALQFGNVSWVSLLANPLVLPPQPLVMVLGGLAALGGMLWLPLGKVLAVAALPFVSYTIRMVELLARLPDASVPVGTLGQGVIVLAALLLVATALSPTVRSRVKTWRWFTPAALALAGFCVLVWQPVLAQPQGTLTLTVMDNPDGQALLVQTPSRRAVVINAGGSSRRLSALLDRRLPILEQEIDLWVFASSEKADLAAAPDTLQRSPPAAAAWMGEPDSSSRWVREVQSTLEELEIPNRILTAGETVDLGDGAALAATENGGLELMWQNFRVEMESPNTLTVLGQEIHPPAEGWVRIVTDGDRLWMEASREE